MPQEPTALQQHLAIHEALVAGGAAGAGRALLTAEQLLGEEGRLSVEWADVWQLPWRRWGLPRAGGVRDGPQQRNASCHDARLQSASRLPHAASSLHPYHAL